MVARSLVFLLALLPLAVRSSPATVVAGPQPDLRVLSAASTRLAHASPAAVARWLRGKSAVRAAAVGRDGRTVTILFRDGVQGDVLPRGLGSMTLRDTRPSSRLVPMIRPAQVGGGRAAVFEPFASELGLGPYAGQPEVSDLQAAGFSVDQANDTSVTIGTFVALAQYNVVYMHTHSGVDSSGRAVVASGEPADGDPAVQPYLQDGTVVITGVAGGGNQAWYGITSTFVTRHMGLFPRHALLFINGCELLASNDFWQALSAQGAGVLLSWNGLGSAKDDYLTAAAFFGFMQKGQSVSAALASTSAAGYGSSSNNGQTASLGFDGDGSITLAQAASGGPPAPASTGTPTVTPTATATATSRPTSTGVPGATATATSPAATSTRVPTDTPTATETPTPTATSTATATATWGLVTPTLKLAESVNPSSRQVLTFHFVPGASVHFTVVFPNGNRLQHTVTAAGDGSAVFSFVQHASEITRESNLASVTVEAQDGTQSGGAGAHYTIGFGKIDVSVEPRDQAPGKRVRIFIHSHAHTHVTARVELHHPAKMTSLTGKQGWTSVLFRLPKQLKAGQQVLVEATFRRGNHLYATHTRLTVT